MENGPSQEEYVRQVLEAYRQTPGTLGTVRRADRLLAAQLYQRGLSVQVIENALVLAAARRLIRWLIFCRSSKKCWSRVLARITSNTCVTSWSTSHLRGKFQPRSNAWRRADDGKAKPHALRRG